MSARFLDINSQHRDRISYPNVCDFVIDVGGTYKDSPDTANDQVLLAFPYETNLCSGGSTFTQIALAVTSSNIVNFYRNSYLEINGEYRLITAYDNTTQVATVSPGFSVAPFALTLYTIRKALPIALAGNVYQDVTGGIAANRSQIVLGALASNQDNAYLNNYVFVAGPSAPGSYQWKRVTAYNGTTKVATVYPPFSQNFPPIGAGIVYEIFRYSYNNVIPLRYFGTEVGTNNPSCASVDLTALIIPNKKVLNGYGGTVLDYPHVYVAVYSEKGATFSNPIISNSPGAPKAIFKCPVTSYNLTTFLALISTGMTQNISFKENDSLRFQIFLPNGEILKFEPETTLYSDPLYGGQLFPIESDPFNQVSLTMSVRR
jgi:hypothetical protein